MPDIDGEIPPGTIEAWLYRDSIDLTAQSKPCAGLLVSIGADGTFTEVATGTTAIPWFDREGVLVDIAEPFNGVLRPTDGGAYLLLAEPVPWTTPSMPEREGRVRYDDADTVVCDKLALAGDELLRTMSVVTDGLHLNRIVFTYRRLL